MEQTLEHRSYPLFSLSIDKDECRYPDLDSLLDHLQRKIEQHPDTHFLGRFDHHRHTRSLRHGQIDPEILAAVNLVFCFGITLPSPQSLAERPRSLGIAELADRYCISFLETPMPLANREIECWVAELRR